MNEKDGYYLLLKSIYLISKDNNCGSARFEHIQYVTEEPGVRVERGIGLEGDIAAVGLRGNVLF